VRNEQSQSISELPFIEKLRCRKNALVLPENKFSLDISGLEDRPEARATSISPITSSALESKKNAEEN